MDLELACGPDGILGAGHWRLDLDDRLLDGDGLAGDRDPNLLRYVIILVVYQRVKGVILARDIIVLGAKLQLSCLSCALN